MFVSFFRYVINGNQVFGIKLYVMRPPTDGKQQFC